MDLWVDRGRAGPGRRLSAMSPQGNKIPDIFIFCHQQ